MDEPSKADGAPANRQIKVWDLPLRVFHWALLLLVVGSFVSEWTDNLDRHATIGFCVLTLLLFRLVWGFIGGTHARFASFVRGPSAVFAYLGGMFGKRPAAFHAGHNPVGALSVLALLISLLLQAVTGLFTTTDEMFEGPLSKLVSSSLSETLTTIHRINSNVLLALVGLHVAAILFYRFVKRENLVSAMLSGRKQVPEGMQAEEARGGSMLAAVVILVIAAAVVWYVVTKL